jgi:hypothetical protein
MAHSTHLVIDEAMDFRTEVEALAAKVKATKSWRRFAYTDANGRQTSCIIYQDMDVEPLIRAYEAGEELPVSDTGQVFAEIIWHFFLRPVGFLIQTVIVGAALKLGIDYWYNHDIIYYQFTWFWSWFAGVIMVALYRYFKQE